MKLVDQIGDCAGKTIIIRADFNVPVKNGAVVDERRIDTELKTIDFVLEKQAKIILVSHIENEGEDALLPVFNVLKNKYKVTFVEANLLKIKEAKEKLKNREIILVENIRNFKGEKENDDNFSQEFASLGDYYVNEAFPVSHRNHASIIGFPKFLPSYIGFRFKKEIEELSHAFNPPHPFIFILGGAKFETKEPLIAKFLEIADHVFVGGALGNDFFKAKGYEIGGSITSNSTPPQSILDNEKILIPIDVVVRASDNRHVVRGQKEILPQEIVSDAGPKTIEMLQKYIMEARMVLWNGPLGFYEKGFDGGTKEIAKIIAESRARSIVGGGDTTAAIKDLGVAERFTFISTGGGAMLEFLAKGTLPGIEVLK
ncbi:MAG: phosphoglycerate kinase [Patescibacteria group bacterium]